uniref:SFRICE_014172 n=1 Tax=Spodoptera frugiperda TaxID=7108 RepID=A0A2H1VSK6_SPOFR
MWDLSQTNPVVIHLQQLKSGSLIEQRQFGTSTCILTLAVHVTTKPPSSLRLLGENNVVSARLVRWLGNWLPRNGIDAIENATTYTYT